MAIIDREFNKQLLEEQTRERKAIADRLVIEAVDSLLSRQPIKDRRIYHARTSKEIKQDNPFLLDD